MLQWYMPSVLLLTSGCLNICTVRGINNWRNGSLYKREAPVVMFSYTFPPKFILFLTIVGWLEEIRV